MAKPNLKGTSFYSLDLDDKEERLLKAHLKENKWSAKRYLRYLIRKDLNINIELNKLDRRRSEDELKNHPSSIY